MNHQWLIEKKFTSLTEPLFFSGEPKIKLCYCFYLFRIKKNVIFISVQNYGSVILQSISIGTNWSDMLRNRDVIKVKLVSFIFCSILLQSIEKLHTGY